MVYNLGVVGEAGMQISTTCVPLFLLLAVSAIIALVNIFLYKNLKLQKSLCSLAMLFAGLWYVDYIVMFMGLIPVPEAEGTAGICLCPEQVGSVHRPACHGGSP